MAGSSWRQSGLKQLVQLPTAVLCEEANCQRARTRASTGAKNVPAASLDVLVDAGGQPQAEGHGAAGRMGIGAGEHTAVAWLLLLH